jgi:hypothetical protein
MSLDQLPHLPDLIGLGLVAFSLEVDHLRDACSAKQMVAAARPFDESHAQKEVAKLVESNSGVGLASQDGLQRLRGRSQSFILLEGIEIR